MINEACEYKRDSVGLHYFANILREQAELGHWKTVDLILEDVLIDYVIDGDHRARWTRATRALYSEEV